MSNTNSVISIEVNEGLALDIKNILYNEKVKFYSNDLNLETASIDLIYNSKDYVSNESSSFSLNMKGVGFDVSDLAYNDDFGLSLSNALGTLSGTEASFEKINKEAKTNLNVITARVDFDFSRLISNDEFGIEVSEVVAKTSNIDVSMDAIKGEVLSTASVAVDAISLASSSILYSADYGIGAVNIVSEISNLNFYSESEESTEEDNNGFVSMDMSSISVGLSEIRYNKASGIQINDIESEISEVNFQSYFFESGEEDSSSFIANNMDLSISNIFEEKLSEEESVIRINNMLGEFSYFAFEVESAKEQEGSNFSIILDEIDFSMSMSYGDQSGIQMDNIIGKASKFDLMRSSFDSDETDEFAILFVD